MATIPLQEYLVGVLWVLVAASVFSLSILGIARAQDTAADATVNHEIAGGTSGQAPAEGNAVLPEGASLPATPQMSLEPGQQEAPQPPVQEAGGQGAAPPGTETGNAQAMEEGDRQSPGPSEQGTDASQNDGQGSPAKQDEPGETASDVSPGEESGKPSLVISGSMEIRAVSAFDHATPTEDPSAELDVDLTAKSGSSWAAKIFIQAVQDGKVRDASNKGAFLTFNQVFQDRTPFIDIDEAYIDFYTAKADVRVGLQKFAWGRLDEINPTDNLNTEDLTSGGMNDEAERKIGAPAIRADVYSDLVTMEIAWVPFFVPYRLPDRDERWFPRVLVPPESVEVGYSVGTVPVSTTYRDMELPPRTIRNSEAGVRFSRHIEGWDVSASYFTGYDPMPLTRAFVDIDIDLVDPLALNYTAASRVTLQPVVSRIHVFGFDFTTTVKDFTIRGEYAYFHNKRYNRKLTSVLDELVTRETVDDMYSDFLMEYFASGGEKTSQTFRLHPRSTLTMDAMKYGLGVDYIYGDTSVSVQLIQEFVPDHDPDMPVYFVKDGFDTIATFLLKQFFLQNTLEMNLRLAYDLEFEDYVIKPSVKYHFTDNLQGTLGLIVIGGKEDDSLFGQFRRNDEVYASLRCSF